MSWKHDTILRDRDGWMSGVGREFQRLGDGIVAIRVRSTNEQAYANDVYHAEQEIIPLRSADRGLTWECYDGPILEENQTRLSDGTLIKVFSGGVVPFEEKRALIARVGGNPETVRREGNDLWPEEKRDELERQGYVVESSFPGIVGTLTGLSCSRSFDDGRTCEYRRIEGLPWLARTYGSFRSVLELQDGTLLAACTGQRTRSSPDFSYALRSTDRGNTWHFHVLAEDTHCRLQFNETALLELPNGRVLAMMRCHRAGEGVGNYLYRSFSDDGGVTWTSFERTPIWGYPAQLILLRSKAVLCTYAHRRHPYGVRACLSGDFGETWDYENEKIIRDDSLPGLVWYPTSIQLDDDTILTAYSLSKIPRVPYREDDQIGPTEDLLVHARKRVGPERRWHGGYHGYAAVSRYTEDYVRGPGQVTSRTRDSLTETGHDEE